MIQPGKDQNLHKVQTKNRYAQSELLKKAQNNNGQKQWIKTEQSDNKMYSKQGSKMSKNESPTAKTKKTPGIIQQVMGDGGSLTPRKLILNNILSNI